MSILVDTSALYALLDRDDANHPAAAAAFPDLLDREELVTHNYVVVESAALAHRWLGPAAARALLEDLLPVVRIVWVDEAVHRVAGGSAPRAQRFRDRKVGRTVRGAGGAAPTAMRRCGPAAQPGRRAGARRPPA